GYSNSLRQISFGQGPALPPWALPPWALPPWALPPWALPPWELPPWEPPPWELPPWELPVRGRAVGFASGRWEIRAPLGPSEPASPETWRWPREPPAAWTHPRGRLAPP